MAKTVRVSGELFPVGKDVDVSFFTFSEWFARPDVQGAADRALEYVRYIRRVRTSLYFCRLCGLNARLRLGSVKKAEEAFARRGLDPARPSSWAAVAGEFETMPEFAVEEKAACGPLGVTVAKRETRAAVSMYSHLPDAGEGIDCVGATIQSGSRHLCDLLVWPNPLLSAAGTGAIEGAVDALYGELDRRGVRTVTVLEGVLPFEACPECGEMALRVPTEWLERSVRAAKVGRNDPCPCGSGLKYKKCCGRVGGGVGANGGG